MSRNGRILCRLNDLSRNTFRNALITGAFAKCDLANLGSCLAKKRCADNHLGMPARHCLYLAIAPLPPPNRPKPKPPTKPYTQSVSQSLPPTTRHKKRKQRQTDAASFVCAAQFSGHRYMPCALLARCRMCCIRAFRVDCHRRPLGA